MKLKRDTMIDGIPSLTIFSFLFLMLNLACSKGVLNAPENVSRLKTGTLYYSAADMLMRYDFQSKTTVAVFSGGDHFRVSPDAQHFLWYRNSFGDATTIVQVHDLENPAKYESITFPYILDQVPQFIPGSKGHYVALARAEDGAVKRHDLVVFSGDNKGIVGRIPHVKAFAILPNGKDLIISAEALDASGATDGFALALVKNFQSVDKQEDFTICGYPDYATLPEDIAVSSFGDELAFTQLDHIYTVPIQENARPTQITQSRFREVDPAWSKDGKYIIFTANTSGPSVDCGEIRIIPSHQQTPIPIPEDREYNEPVDDLQPIDVKGKTIHACGSESYLWL